MWMSKNRSWLILLVAVFALPVQAAERHHEAQGGFSYEIPAQWEVREYPGLKYQILFTQPVDNFAPNVNFVDEDYAGDLDTYADANLPVLEKVISGFKLISRGSGKTRQGREYRSLRFIQTTQSGELTQISYFLKLKKDRKLVVTCTTPSSQASRFDKVFSRVIASIRID